MRFTFLGCGDAFGSGGRLNTCFHVAAASGDFLIDCGASAMIAIRRYGVVPNDIRTVVLSHLHGDHFAGLPFFVLDAQLYSKRESPLTVVGPPGTPERLEQVMEIMFAGSSRVARRFEVDVVEVRASAPVEVNNLEIRAFEVTHPSGAPSHALRIGCDDRTIAYTGDTDWVEDLAEVGRNADLFVAEALFYDRQVRYHLDFATLSGHLDRIAPKKLALTHMGPDMLANRHKVPDGVVLAEDGLEITI